MSLPAPSDCGHAAGMRFFQQLWKPMKQIGTKEGIVWILIGGVICTLSWKIDLGSFHEPRAGFVSFFSGAALIVIGMFMTLSKTFSREPLSHPVVQGQRSRLLYTLGLLLGFGLVLNALGYIVTAFLMLSGLFYDRGTNCLFFSVLASLLTVVITYLIFETWLHVQLPRGILPWW
jgi:hypothetical protein